MHDWQIIFAAPEKIFELDGTLFYCFIRHFYLPFLFEASLDSWHKDLTINSLSTLFAFHTTCPLCQLPFLLHFRALQVFASLGGKKIAKNEGWHNLICEDADFIVYRALEDDGDNALFTDDSNM